MISKDMTSGVLLLLLLATFAVSDAKCACAGFLTDNILHGKRRSWNGSYGLFRDTSSIKIGITNEVIAHITDPPACAVQQHLSSVRVSN